MWYLIFVTIIFALPLAVIVAVKKFHLLEPRPDARLTYTGANGTPRELHAFFAQDRRGGPAVLFFHGGGWQYGSPQLFYPQCRYLAACGYSCFSAEYNLGDASGPDIPAAVSDARAAFSHLIANARELGIDPARIAAGGGSSGGHLAAMLGVNNATDARPAALLLYNPALDFAPSTRWHHHVDDDWQAVSPLQQVAPGYPPTLIIMGSADTEVSLATVEAFCAKVQAAGSVCDSAVYEGLGHGFFNEEPWLGQTNERVAAFLEKLAH